MQTLISKACIVMLCILIPQITTSQIFIPVKENQVKKEIALTIGLEPEIVATISYRHAVISESERTVFIGSSIKLAPMILDNQAVKLNAFTQLTYFTSNKIDFTVMPQLFYAR
ncbi:MAG TPA: hypothetical protein VGD17_16015, partial [Chitinophagaceae bacterium]